MFSATLIPGQGAARYGFSFGASGSGTGGSTLEINPSDRRVAWKSTPTSGAAAPPSLGGVEELAKPVKIKLVVQGTIADLDINGSRTLIHRLPEPSLSSLSVFSEGGDLTITDLKIEPIGQTPLKEVNDLEGFSAMLPAERCRAKTYSDSHLCSPLSALP